MYLDNRIYILGVGSIGKFVAHALRKQHPGLPISLLLHRPGLVGDWDTSGRTIECVTNGSSDKQGGFDVELIFSSVNQRHSRELETPIEYLIVATKTYVTAHALGLIKHRLRSSSSVLFLQNGIGVVRPSLVPYKANGYSGTMDEVSASVFSDFKSQPSYWAGICSCSIYCTSSFSIVHAGRGAIEVGSILSASYGPSFSKSTAPASPDFMIQLFLETLDIEPILLMSDQLREAQLRKLTANAIINPLTAVFRCKKGELLDHPQRFALMRALFEEVADIVRAMWPRTSQSHGDSVFAKENIWLRVLRIAESARESESSMFQDIEAGRRTEIDYINGYLASQGRRFGLTCINNSAIVDMVKQRRVIKDSEIWTAFKLPDPVLAYP